MAFQIGKYLVKIRKQLDLTQEEMAKTLDISTGYYQKLEYGADPSIPMLDKIMKSLNMGPEVFFGVLSPKISPHDAASLVEPVLKLLGASQRRKSLILALISSDLSYLESLDKSQSLHAQALLKAL